MVDIAKDGVARSLNPAQDTVVDYIQLNERQITEYFLSRGEPANLMPGV